MVRVRLNRKSAAALAVLALPASVAYFLSTEQITLVVEDKSGRSGTFINVGTSKRSHSGSKFLIFGPDGVFQVRTSYAFMKFEALSVLFRNQGVVLRDA